MVTGLLKIAGATISQFDAVAFNADGEVVPAKADSSATMPAIGISQEAGAEGSEIEIQYIGPSLCRSDLALVPDGVTFVSSSEAGKLTQTAPSAEGTYQQQVGVSIGAATIMVNVQKSVYRRPSA